MRSTLLYIIALVLTIAASGQTLNVTVGSVVYQFPAAQTGEMTYADGTTVTIMGKTFNLADIDAMTVDNTEVTDNQVRVEYGTSSAIVYVAGNVAQYVEPSVSDAHVVIDQFNTDAVDDDEITYQLSGETADGSLTLSGSYRCTVSLAGVTLKNPSGAAINITNKKRIQLSAKENTVNTLVDGSDGPQKACIYSKGQLQLQGRGTLNVFGNTSHAIKSASYISVKNLTLNISSAGDGINCEEYFLMKSGAMTIAGVSDDGIQCDLGDEANPTGEIAEDTAAGIDAHEDEDSGNVYLEGGTLNITATADAAKGLKAAGDVKISNIELTVTQTGGITTAGDLSYPTSIKAGGNIDITGGTITINNTADGGKGISADGAITIDESNATTVINVTANGRGGSATITEGDDDDDDDDTTPSSYVVYVTLPTSGGSMGPGGGSNAWITLYLYKSDGTLVQQLTSTVTKTSGSSTVKFYYYDFGGSSTDTYYFKSADYTSRGGFGGGATYSIVSETFSGPTSGSDYYYSISNSYTTSGSTRTYKISNVTNTYSSSSSDTSDDGIGYNAMGIKADGNLTIAGGNVTVRNSGAMSKSLKSKATLTINGGIVSLTPSGAMQVIGGDASYSSAVKCVDFIQNDGTLTITASGTAGKGISATNITTNGGVLKINNSGAAQSASSGDYYTAKGIKADGYMKLLAGTVTVTMSGNGGKGIKVNGAYTQGSADGNGPTLTVSTTGSAAGSGSSGGMWGGGGESLSGTPKGIKVVGTIYLYGGTSEVSTKNNGGEGLESKTAIYIEGGKHYFACYDDCINSSGKIFFNGGYTVCYSNGNDAVDSNAGQSGAITIGNGAVFAYTTKGSPEEGLDCDNNSYIQITGTGYAISAGASQGGGGWGGSSSTISNAKQGYYFCTSSVSYASGRYYTIADGSGNNLVTYSFPASCSSSLSLFTAKGMVKGSSYNIKYSTTEPTDAAVAWHGLYIGSTHSGSSSVVSFTAQ